jgi:hypothetical protein
VDLFTPSDKAAFAALFFPILWIDNGSYMVSSFACAHFKHRQDNL